MWVTTRNGDLINLDQTRIVRMVLDEGMTRIEAVFGPGEADWVEIDTVDSKPWEVSLWEYMQARKFPL